MVYECNKVAKPKTLGVKSLSSVCIYSDYELYRINGSILVDNGSTKLQVYHRLGLLSTPFL